LRILALLEANSITGTAKAVLEYAREAAGGIEVANFVRGAANMNNSLTWTMEAENIPLRLIKEKGRFDTAVMPYLRELVDQLDPQIIWSNSVKSHFLVRWLGVQQGRKWVAFHHGYTSPDFKMRCYNQLDRFSLRQADLTVTVCQAFADQLVRRGVPSARIRVQHMPIRPFTVDPVRVRLLREELGIDAQTRVVLSVGRLSREKGHAFLIKAFAECCARNKADDPALILVGDGPESASLRQLAGSCLPPKSVIFTGHRDDVSGFYGLADIFVLPSLSEGTPNVLLEAMAAKVPVIASNVGGIPELAIDGVNALLVPSGNVSALSQAMEQLLSSSKLRLEFSSAAGKVVLEHSPQSYYRALHSIFEEVMLVV
jgi:glycosyltransferase involved in cell wall biosynthesis